MTRHSQSRIFAYFANLRYLFVIAALFGMLSSLVGPAYAAGGENGGLSGKIVDANGAPIAGATVTISSPQGRVTQSTVRDGTFQFLSAPVDTYVISVEAPGYQAFTQAGIGVTGGSNNTLGTLRLTKTTDLKTIGTTRSRSASSAFVPNQTVPQTTISGSTLVTAQGKAANVSEQQALLAAPGFQVDKEGGFIIEGSLTDQVHYNFDGVDFTDPGFNASANNAFFNGISSIQVIPGAGDPSQGNSGSGVVNLVVKRGTYPATGLADIEFDTHVNDHQIGFQYGVATRNNSVSDFVSFFKTDNDIHFGGYNSSNLDNGTVVNPNSQTFLGTASHATDFVNNFVVKFGHNQNQSFQILNLFHTNYTEQNAPGIASYPYDNQNPSELGLLNTALFYDGYGPLTTPQIESITGKDSSQVNGATNAGDVPVNDNSELLKLEYDNTFNPTTYLNLRFFHSDVDDFSNGAESQIGLPSFAPLSGQTSGGSRTGANFELFKQANSKNLLTLSGSYELNRPNFGSIAPFQGLETLGPNVALFVHPANVNAPVSAANPCPIAGAFINPATGADAGCALQQYFYAQGGTPTVPTQDLSSKNIQNLYGLGIRDQFQVTDRLRLDIGARYDRLNNGYGSDLTYEDEATQAAVGNPYYYPHNYAFVETPHFLEPRYGASYQITRNDTVGLEYGRSINEEGSGELASPEAFDEFRPFANTPITPAIAQAFITGTQFPFGNPPVAPITNAAGVVTGLLCKTAVTFPVGATSTSSPSYKGSVGTTLQLGRPCASLGDALYQQEDAYFPEIAAVQPAVIDNVDFNYAHQFRNGMAVKLAPFFRNEYRVQAITAPLIFNPATQTFSVGSLTSLSSGRNTTTGVNFDFTLPDRPVGFTGFLNMTYVNEFTNTPAAGDNANSQDAEPLIPAQFALVNGLFRAGFVSPFTANLGVAYKTRSGFRFNPVLHFEEGYPYNAGTTTPDIVNGKGVVVPNTNLTDYYQDASGGAPLYVDPANPGSLIAPNISASRGEKETPAGGGLLSRPQLTGDMTVEFTPPHSRSTIGVQLLDIFNNQYEGTPTPNNNYFPVTAGVAGPLTGQSPTNASAPNQVNLIAKNTYPYGAYVIPINTSNQLPTTLRLYYQLAL